MQWHESGPMLRAMRDRVDLMVDGHGTSKEPRAEIAIANGPLMRHPIPERSAIGAIFLLTCCVPKELVQHDTKPRAYSGYLEADFERPAQWFP
jgi:hypothetical protein